MNDMLFNVALVLLATNAAIQFCAQAFALYANETAIHEIWGDQVSHLRHCCVNLVILVGDFICQHPW